GIWFHAYFVTEQKPKGFKWGRGNGWVAVAEAELLSALPPDHPKRPAVLGIYRRHMAGIQKRQDTSGLWHQVLDHPELSWGTETSCSGQFAYAMARGLNRGWLDETFRETLRRALTGIASRVTPEGGLNGVCQSTSIGRDLEYYNARPKKDNDQHGFGLVLFALAEAYEMENKKTD
ncbi:MAG: glycoside hydrolase family 88 protein, partial [Pseudolabrys sp.]|nr:glycoside hydrolase family 88 protein [Pseudolabrys sp.]